MDSYTPLQSQESINKEKDFMSLFPTQSECDVTSESKCADVPESDSCSKGGGRVRSGLCGSHRDMWSQRGKNMRCKTCMYYLTKERRYVNPDNLLGRCRRHAPTMSGFPVVYPDDWCGDHKLDVDKL